MKTIWLGVAGAVLLSATAHAAPPAGAANVAKAASAYRHADYAQALAKEGVRVHFLLTCFACADGRFWRGRRGGTVGLRWPDGSGRGRGRVGVAGGCG